MQKGLIVHTLITNDKGEILILQRSKIDDVLPEYWDIPGGTLEDGEDPAVGAIRETKEEAGIDIVNPKLFFYRSKVDIKKDKQFVALIFWTKVSNTQIILNPEDHQSYAWIKPSEINKYQTVEYLEDCVSTYLELSNR
jgi:8-oxo-dGTP pyrophosphatase MutT (NUDIX family)